MAPYGNDHHKHNDFNSTKHGKLASKNRRTSRRLMKRRTRIIAKNELRNAE
jgi:hypothetical protein